MTASLAELTELWGADQVVYFPLDKLGSTLAFGPELLSPGGVLPENVPILFTVYTDESPKLFDLLEVEVGDTAVLHLVVLGAAPDSSDLRFCLDTATGVVGLIDVTTPSAELVNSSHALFVEFLYRLTQLILADDGHTSRAPRAQALRDELNTADPAAFADPESWWSMAFDQLIGSA